MADDPETVSSTQQTVVIPPLCSNNTRQTRGPTKDQSVFRKEYKRTSNLRRSMLAAGYSDKVARQGLTVLPDKTRKWVLAKAKKLDKLAALGVSFTQQEQENLLRGAVFSNISEGKDRAVQSIRLGMQDKRVSMLTPDSQTGVFVLNVPGSLQQKLGQVVNSDQLDSGNSERKTLEAGKLAQLIEPASDNR